MVGICEQAQCRVELRRWRFNSKHHCKVIFGDHRGLAENPETNLLVQMQGVIAEYEREKILRNLRFVLSFLKPF